MNIRVVCSDLRSDWVIARLGRHLLERNGWRGGGTPDARADVNLYWPYVFYRPDRHPKGTLAVGFMTHRESGPKGEMWQRAAKGLALRGCMAERYARELADCGPTAAIPVCYETDLFQPRHRVAHERPVVGLGGTVYRSGRKGEKLALALYKAKRLDWQIVASGKARANSVAWPIPSHEYIWRDMPRYYWGLDVYVSTSHIEGGPVTLLEALGCGRPVVIGEGVGIESELPHVPGIERYQVGELDSLIAAIERALSCPASPAALSALVSERTPERWARAWRNAIHDMGREA